MIVITIKSGNDPGQSIEDLILAQAALQVVVKQIEANGHKAPEKIVQELETCTRNLNRKLRADRQRQLSLLKLQRQSLLPNEVKLAETEAEIKRLETELSTP